jgi:hypothetical protein
MALMVVFAVFSMGAMWVGIANHQGDGSAQHRRREQAFAAAEAGVNQAMSRLAADPFFTGTALSTVAAGAGQYETTVTQVNPLDPTDARRYIVSKGYSPLKTAPKRSARRIEEYVELASNASFHHALFAAPGGITTSNNMTVTGSMYSGTALTLASNAKVFGPVTAQGAVTTSTSSTIGGDLTALGNITVNDSGTTVQGNAFAGGVGSPTANITMTGCVKGTAQASGTVTGTPPAGCPTNWVASSPPVPPTAEALPTFTWNPADYASSFSWATPASFTTYWTLHRLAFSGVHKVTCASPCLSSITLNAATILSGDTTIITDSPITIDAGITNSTGGTVNLTIISTSANSPAVYLTNNVSTLANSIHVLLYANNGPIQFRNVKNFSGSVYGKSIVLDLQFTLTWTAMNVPGFTWPVAAGGHSVVVTRDFKEVPFS